MDIRGVVFDVDDTLYDMAQPFLGAYQALYGKRCDLPVGELFLAFRRHSDERFADSQTGKMTMEELYIYRVRMMLRDYDVEVTDAEALQAFQLLSRKEGIIPALESSHALAYALKRAAAAERDQQPVTIVVSLSGRGDKDVEHVRRTLEAHPELVLENM